MTNDLIDREALMDEISAALLNARFTSVRAREQHEEKIQWALDLVGEAPAVDAAPVVHGRWIEGTLLSRLICSECGHEALYNENANEPYFTKFCPECGARMDKEG